MYLLNKKIAQSAPKHRKNASPSLPEASNATHIKSCEISGLAIELRSNGISAQQQVGIPVRYREQIVGEFYADMVVGESLILELKAVREIAKEHEVQLVNYLCATGIDIGLLINFGESVQVRRKFRVYRPKA